MVELNEGEIMKVIEVVKAKEPLKRLTEKRLSNYKVLRNLVKLGKSVDAEVEFYSEQEKKAVNQYAEKDEKGNPVFLTDGRLKLTDTNAKIAFETEISKLNETEIDGITVVEIHESDFSSSSEFPTAVDMLALEPIVHFVD